MVELTTPISAEEIHALQVGDAVSLNGVIVTGRDAAHKFMVEHFIRQPAMPEEQPLYAELMRLLNGGVIYHCGPVVKKHDDDTCSFVAAGPTTSIREEIYQQDVIAHFNLRGIIGKGGMGPDTLKACQEHAAVYFHAIGGIAPLIAQAVKQILAVHKLEFGIPEAMWVIRVKHFPVIVTMDSHGQSLHERVKWQSQEILTALLE